MGIDLSTLYLHISLPCDSWLLLTGRHSHPKDKTVCIPWYHYIHDDDVDVDVDVEIGANWKKDANSNAAFIDQIRQRSSSKENCTPKS